MVKRFNRTLEDRNETPCWPSVRSSSRKKTIMKITTTLWRKWRTILKSSMKKRERNSLKQMKTKRKKIIIQTNPKLLYMFGLRWKLEPKEEVRDFITTGPYIVLGAVSDLMYKVKKSKTKKPKYIHCDQIKILWSDR